MKILLPFLLVFSVFARGTISKNRFEQLSGKKYGSKEKVYWNKRYDRSSYIFGKAPERFLSRNYHYIPNGSKVLDIAMGEGHCFHPVVKRSWNTTNVICRGNKQNIG